MPKIQVMGAVIAQQICLHLPSCCPGFESQAYHLRFFHLQFLCYMCHVKRTKINKKRPGLAHFLNVRFNVQNNVCATSCTSYIDIMYVKYVNFFANKLKQSFCILHSASAPIQSDSKFVAKFTHSAISQCDLGDLKEYSSHSNAPAY